MVSEETYLVYVRYIRKKLRSDPCIPHLGVMDLFLINCSIRNTLDYFEKYDLRRKRATVGIDYPVVQAIYKCVESWGFGKPVHQRRHESAIQKKIENLRTINKKT